MNTYNFELSFKINGKNQILENIIDKLYENGFEDALIGTGREGYIGIIFQREGKTKEEAFKNSVNDIKNIIPNAELLGDHVKYQFI